MSAPPRKRVRVVAALVERDGRVLAARRLANSAPRASRWEFPGGKVEPGESEPAALVREIREELGCEARVGALFGRVHHDYADIEVELALYRCELSGEPQLLGVAELRWVPRAELLEMDFLEADRPLLERLARDNTPA
jgi:8-oxo-dGTP diphosphatase